MWPNPQETVKAVTLAFRRIPLHFIRNVCVKFGSPYMPQSPDFWQNSDRGVSDFWISGQSLTKRKCHNSRTSDDIDMKLGLVTKLDKRKKQRQENLTMTSCRKILTSLPFFNLQPIWRNPETGFRTHSL